MKEVPRRLAVLCALAGALAVAHANDVNTWRLKAQTCAVCHGPLGLSVTPDAPNLAGQPALTLRPSCEPIAAVPANMK